MWKSRFEPCLRVLRVAAAVVVMGGVLAMAGCDSGGARLDSQYQTLSDGHWEVAELRVEGENLTSQLEQRYDSVLLEFGEGGNGARTYQLIGARTEDTLRVRGSISLSEPNGLTMVEGFDRPVSWTWNFDQPDELSTSVRFRLPRVQAAGSAAFLNMLLPGQGWGEAQEVRLDLLFREEVAGKTMSASNFSQDG